MEILIIPQEPRGNHPLPQNPNQREQSNASMKTETADDQDHGTPPDVISSEKTSNHSTPRALNAAEVRALELQPDASAEGGTREF